jgi:glycosyltransferase involved in cell wall biosynthesis
MDAPIAHLCYAGISGATGVALQIVRHARSREHAVVLYGVEGPSPARREELAALGCAWSYVPKRPGLDVMGYRRAAAALARTGASSAIFHGLATVPVLAWLAVLRPRIGRIVVHHGPPGAPASAGGWAVCRLDAMLSDAMVAVSAELGGELASRLALAGAGRVIDNGVDVEWWSPRGPRSPRAAGSPWRLAMVGSFNRHKNQAGLIGVVARLRREGRDVRLTLAGVGATRAQCQALARGLASSDAVRFVGSLSARGVRELLAETDVYVQMSHREGMPLAVLEAMASGVPVAGTDLPGLGDGIDSARGGLMVLPRDEQAAARRLGRWLDELERPGGWEHGSRAVREVANARFDARRMAGEYEALAWQVERRRRRG